MGELLLDIMVDHEPQQVGSKEAYVVYKDRKTKTPARRPDGSIIVNVTDENAKAKPFMQAVYAEALKEAWDASLQPVEGVSFELEATFYVKRPDSHWGTGRNAHLLKPSAPARPFTAPDEDKLLRCTQDALEGIAWKNDSQVVRAVAEKRYAVPGKHPEMGCVHIRILRATEQDAADLPVDEQTRVLPGRAHPDDDDQPSLLTA